MYRRGAAPGGRDGHDGRGEGWPDAGDERSVRGDQGVFGGYYMFDVANLDEALELAARIPSARLGGKVEVRPIVEQPS